MFMASRKTTSHDDESPRRQPSGKRKGVIVGATLALSVATGPVWAAPSEDAAACTPVFAGRAGMVPCAAPNSKTDDAIEKFIGTTTTGCVVGFVFGYVPGMIAGCVGGAVGNIAW
jgi:hypothetical protein